MWGLLKAKKVTFFVTVNEDFERILNGRDAPRRSLKIQDKRGGFHACVPCPRRSGSAQAGETQHSGVQARITETLVQLILRQAQDAAW